jgi:hypothetical protein
MRAQPREPRYRSHGSRTEDRRVGQASRRPPHHEAVGDRGQGDPTREGVCALGRCARVRPFHQERTDPDWKPEVSGTRSRPRSGEALRRCLRWSLKVTLTRSSNGGASTRRTAPSLCPCGATTAHVFVRLLPTSVSAGLRPSRTPKPKSIKPVKPKPPRRETLQRRLQKVESEAAQLREQLKNLPTETDPGSSDSF